MVKLFVVLLIMLNTYVLPKFNFMGNIEYLDTNKVQNLDILKINGIYVSYFEGKGDDRMVHFIKILNKRELFISEVLFLRKLDSLSIQRGAKYNYRVENGFFLIYDKKQFLNKGQALWRKFKIEADRIIYFADGYYDDKLTLLKYNVFWNTYNFMPCNYENLEPSIFTWPY